MIIDCCRWLTCFCLKNWLCSQHIILWTRYCNPRLMMTKSEYGCRDDHVREPEWLYYCQTICKAEDEELIPGVNLCLRGYHLLRIYEALPIVLIPPSRGRANCVWKTVSRSMEGESSAMMIVPISKIEEVFELVTNGIIEWIDDWRAYLYPRGRSL